MSTRLGSGAPLEPAPAVHPAWTAAPRWVRVLVAAVPAAAVAAPLVVACGRVPLFRDEVATAQLAALPLVDLWRATEHVDRVMLPFLLLMKGWTGLAGDSAVSLRAPSVVATLALVAVVAGLAGRLSGPVGAAVAGTTVAVVPVTASLAVLARPYAGAALVALLAVLVLHLALTSGRRAWWWAHVALTTASLLLQPFAVMALPAHLALVATVPTRRRWRHVAGGWAVAGGVALLVTAGAGGQQGHVGWIAEVGPRAALTMLEGALSEAVLGLAVVGGVVGLVLVATRRAAPWWWVGGALAAVPPLALGGLSILLHPAVVERYLFLVPAGAALLVGGLAGVLAEVVVRSSLATAVRCGPAVGAGVILGVALASTLVLPQVEARPVGGGPPAARWSVEPPSPLAGAVADVLVPGDLLVVEQRVGWGGYAGDLSRAWGDEDFATALDRRAVAGELTDVTRSVSATGPSVTTDSFAAAGPRRVVLLSLRGTARDRFLVAAGTPCAAGPGSADARLGDSHLWVIRCASAPDATSLSTVADHPER